jgi:hypothetical protein
VASRIVAERRFANHSAEFVDGTRCERRLVGVDTDRRHRLPSVH